MLELKFVDYVKLQHESTNLKKKIDNLSNLIRYENEFLIFAFFDEDFVCDNLFERMKDLSSLESALAFNEDRLKKINHLINLYSLYSDSILKDMNLNSPNNRRLQTQINALQLQLSNNI